MLKLILSLTVFAFTSFAFSQQPWCGTDQILQNLKTQNPGFEQHMHKSMLKASNGWVNQTGAIQKISLDIPVVVHIIHDNGIGNISDEQIFDALRILNEDYNRLNPDTNVTRNTLNAPFKPIAGDMDVHFKLAKIDPNGNCTNGIIRINAPELTYDADDACKFSSNGGSDQWPMDKYLNIWVVNSINSGGVSGTILGYAYLPYWPNGANYGILIRHDSFGTIETATASDGRTLTHEMGHLLGLQHIFDPGFSGATGCHTDDCNAAGDYCCDTPPQTDANWSCSQTYNSCNSVPLNDQFGFDVYDQIENYMSYNACQNMFSRDQANIMQQNFIDINFMANMVTPQNIAATGVNDPEILCLADFEANKFQVCGGDSIQFTDLSYHNPVSWNWVVTPGLENIDWVYIAGTNATSQDPKIKFLTLGNYQISMQVSDGTLTQTEIKNQYIRVLPASQTLPYWEGFEGISDLNSTLNWSTYNAENNSTFEIAQTTAYTGTHSVKLGNYGQTGLNTDELLSAPIDMSSIDAVSGNVTLSFRYAYRKKLADDVEWLRVFVSDDCGDSWQQRKSIHGNTLSPYTSSANWSPASINDWTTVHVTNITSSFFIENFRFKFQFKSDNGNNLFIDDINLYAGNPSDDLVVGIAEGEAIEHIQLFPNPSDAESTLIFELQNNDKTIIEVQSIDGTVAQRTVVNTTFGKNIVLLNNSELSQGMYFIVIRNAGTSVSIPLIIK